MKEKTKTATFAMGCFWGPQYFFDMQDGVLETTVGYAGGEKVNPSYHDLGTHSEAVQIKYDSKTISFDNLLESFWNEHNPSFPTVDRYKSIIFYHNEEQKEKAERSLQKRRKESLMPILTEVKPAGKFHPAEDYHQKFIEKNHNPKS